jgi:hypothetical protein
MTTAPPCEVCEAFDANLRTWDGSLARDESGHHPDCYRGNDMRAAIRREGGPTVPERRPLVTPATPPCCERCGSPHFVEYTSRGQYLCDGCYPRTRVVGARCRCPSCTKMVLVVPPRTEVSSAGVYFRGERVADVSGFAVEHAAYPSDQHDDFVLGPRDHTAVFAATVVPVATGNRAQRRAAERRRGRRPVAR